MWTYPPRRILAALDFAEASAAGLALAGHLASAYQAELTAFHAETFEAPPYFTREQVAAIEHQRRAARREALAYVERYAAQFTRHRVRAVVSEVGPAEGILEAAREQDLIVMGTHGRRGPARWWAGSVAERVVRQARSPVLVVRGPVGDVGEVFARIVVVARGGTYDGAARRYASGLAETFHGQVSRETGSSMTDAALSGASLVVLAQPGSSPALSGAADRILRTCHRPLLLVPTI